MHHVLISYVSTNYFDLGTVDDHTVDIDESFLELQRWCPLVSLLVSLVSLLVSLVSLLLSLLSLLLFFLRHTGGLDTRFREQLISVVTIGTLMTKKKKWIESMTMML